MAQGLGDLFVFIDQGADSFTFDDYEDNASLTYGAGLEICGERTVTLVDAAGRELGPDHMLALTSSQATG